MLHTFRIIMITQMVLCFLVFADGSKNQRKMKNYSSLTPIKPTKRTPTVELDLEICFQNSDEELARTIMNHKSWKYLDPDCGENHQDRIVGGVDAALGQHPWIVRLGRYTISNGIASPLDWFCAGSLISKHYIVSAAHCTTNTNFRIIRLGEYDVNQLIDCDVTGACAPLPQDRFPLEVLNHPGFLANKVTTPSDISIILMSEPAEINGWVAPICLPRSYSPGFISGNSEAIGWGLVKTKPRQYPSILQSIQLPIISEAECKQKYYRTLSRGTFCAGGEPKKDSCNGDSGGPLIKVDDTIGSPRYYLIGVVSFGPSECGKGPGAYTNITFFLPWLLNHIEI